MKIGSTIALVASGLLLAGQATAQESLLEYVIDACAGDLEQYCSTVTPGDGRVMHCIAAHEDKLSGECEVALYEAASLLQELTLAIVYVASSCETEIDTLCGDVVGGEGRILACLTENVDELGESCSDAIVDAATE